MTAEPLKSIPPVFPGDKAAVLSRLEGRTRHSHIGQQVCINERQWRQDQPGCIQAIQSIFTTGSLIIRSSHSQEDGMQTTLAGQFKSFGAIDVNDPPLIATSIDRVFDSYSKSSKTDSERVLIQQHLDACVLVGVMLTRSLNSGAPYDHISYLHHPLSTDGVTSGADGPLQQFISLKHAPQALKAIPKELEPIMVAARELERLCQSTELNIEFGIDSNQQVHVFQVRQIPAGTRQVNCDESLLIKTIKRFTHQLSNTQPATKQVLGDQSVYGIMPDWNPAEIIGIKPRPLALSLYQFVLMDEIWAEQRYAWGYRDLRGVPLLTSFGGCPYVDVRISLNSLIPAALDEAVAKRLVDAQITHLKQHPQLHDQLEFEVAVSVLTPAFDEAAARQLVPHGVTEDDLNQLRAALRDITAKAMLRLQEDLKPTKHLLASRTSHTASAESAIQQGIGLINEVKRLGALPFAHAARSAFLAVAWLRDMVKTGLLTEQEKNAFIGQIKTVSGQFKADMSTMPIQELIAEYGHLRPGTYDITSPAYWEKPELYFYRAAGQGQKPNHQTHPFELSHHSRTSINQWLKSTFENTPVADWQADDLLDFCRQAIVLREASKFEFTRNLSLAIDRFIEFGQAHDLSREQLSYLTMHDLLAVADNPWQVPFIRAMIAERTKQHALSQCLELPHLITRPQDLCGFKVPQLMPSYITHAVVEAPLKSQWHAPQKLHGCVVLLEQADPGFDWLFNYGIAGLMTAHGGANSHMAIRAAELNVPACIGLGKSVYENMSHIEFIRLDCAARQWLPVAQ
ncbi:PEP-utilizing enzyme [Marinicella meishanensis]|uniref:PEP-utilizing enzyme n=1 Tax=Marinicella meishanensis TaxID=2873263 RepID=UPI001CC198D4|nr:PEP-utilizing enzyme [Marinicella sp. NBU2979]